jgi:hypothetical protein
MIDRSSWGPLVNKGWDSQMIQQCCGSGMFIPDPDIYPSRIPDPKTATKERGEKKFVVIPFFCSHKFHKIKIILFLKF